MDSSSDMTQRLIDERYGKVKEKVGWTFAALGLICLFLIDHYIFYTLNFYLRMLVVAVVVGLYCMSFEAMHKVTFYITSKDCKNSGHILEENTWWCLRCLKRVREHKA